ncbi:hypothetical protein RHSIM_Rhsim02G0038900 [Rhododendron simsii]|uniref:DUF4283 domain-containing protein n=1 Tax=Rhododendron simsii TaxID=118357 RepID=A0A834HAR5_RHOSS|nr:hypothetical protein RHSIM_Rhsim02G0038900 [Rhododendron simsii]
MADEVVELIGNCHLSDEEDDVIPIADEVCKQAVEACSFSLVGKLLTSKKFNVTVMKDSLRRAWGSPENLHIVEVGDNLFHFRFDSETNLRKVLNGGPWNFDNYLLVLQEWESGMKAEQVSFQLVPFWVQLWGLPFEFVNPVIGEIIGKRIGSFFSVDNRAVMGERGRFIRVRVGVPVDKPLKRGGFIALGNGTKFWVDYKFERLNRFCYYCGSLLHEHGNCGVRSSDEGIGILKEGKFGAWMKAGGGGAGAGRQQPNSKWFSGGARDGVLRTVGSGKFKLGGDKDSAQISDKENNSGLIEIKDNDWVAINGKETRMGDLLPKSKDSVLGGNKGVLGPSGSDVDGLGGNGPELCGGLGPVLSQGNPNGAGSSFLIEASPLGHYGQAASKITGVGPIESSPDLNLQDVVVSQSFDEATLGPAFSFGAAHSKIVASSSGGAKRSKGKKRNGVQSDSKLRRSEKENSGVTGKKRLLNDEQNVKGTNLEGGVGNPLTIRQLKGVCNLYSPDLVFLAETKNKKEKIEKIAKIVGLGQVLTVEPVGLSGGECLIAKDGVKLDVVEMGRGIIDVRVTDVRGGCSRVVGVYASTDHVERRNLWRRLAVKVEDSQEPCVLGGDFNCILDNEEKSGGLDKEEWELKDFRSFVEENDLIDIGYVGYPFTWNNKRGGRTNIRMRLDRVIVNSQWRSGFPNGSLLHLSPGGSDHCPILLRYGVSNNNRISRFIFDSRWTSREACGDIVRACWAKYFVGSRWFRVQQKIRLCRKRLRQWRSSQMLNSGKRLKELQVQLEVENERESFNAEEYRKVEEDMKQATIEEENYWRAKSKVAWLRHGDKNTAFFHAKTVQRRANNRIHGLEDRDGIWKDKSSEVEGIICDYFQHMFSSSNPSSIDEVIQEVQPKISSEMNARLLRLVSSGEVSYL